MPSLLDDEQDQWEKTWQQFRLGDVCSKIGSGATPRGGKDVYLEEGTYTLIRSQNVYNQGFHHDGLVFLSEHHAKELKNVEVFEEDILLNITGDSVARVCQVAPEVLPARVNQHVAIIRPDAGSLDPGYLRYYLVSPEMQDLLLSWAASGGTRNALTKAMIESLEISVPSLADQQAIAHVLGTLDDKIEVNRRMNRTLEEIAQAIFRDWFVDFGPTRAKMEGQEPYLPPDLWDMFPDELVDSEMGGIPEGWEAKPLGHLVTLNPKETLKKGTEAPYLDMASLPTDGCNPTTPSTRGFNSGSRFRNGDTLLARITPCLENGKTAYLQCFPEETVGWGSTEFIVMRGLPPVPSEYTYLLARDPTFRSHAILSMTGTSGRQRVQTESLSGYLLPLPPVCILRAFATEVRPLFRKIESNRGQTEALTTQRDALLPELVSGKTSIQEAGSEIS